MIILRSPKGWTCPKEIDGKRAEDSWRSHQVPMGEMHEKPEHIKILEQWMKSYKPEELFDANGRFKPELRRNRAQGRAPHERQSARQRRPAPARSAHARLPQIRRRSEEARRDRRRGHARHGQVPARRDEAEHGEQKLPPVQPRRKQLEPLAGRARSDEPRLDGGDVSITTIISRPTAA